MFLIGWITLGIMSSLDVCKQLDDLGLGDRDQGGVWVLNMLGPVTVILSQKILFGARKMGTKWEESGKPNFHPVSLVVVPHVLVWQGTLSPNHHLAHQPLSNALHNMHDHTVTLLCCHPFRSCTTWVGPSSCGAGSSSSWGQQERLRSCRPRFGAMPL